jgi:predicted AlkP superfamily pyrophosphatase or phosphodiesterase
MTTRAVVVSIDGFAAFYWSDPVVRAPNLRRLAETGTSARSVEVVFPSTTWPTHVSLVTGVRPDRHGVVGNSILNRVTGQAEHLTGDPLYDAADLLRAPTVYDVAHAAGLRTAAVDWPASRRAASLDFNLPFFKDQRVFETQTAPAVWAELGALGYPLDRQGEWAQLPRRFLKDAMVADVAAHVARRHRPDLLLVHFLCVDSHQHLHGPRSPEAYWAIEYVDALIGRLLAALPDRADTVVYVVSDHGFMPVEREARVNVRLRRRGLLRVGADGRVQPSAARLVSNLGAAWVYVTDRGDAPALARDLAAELAGMDGIGHVWTEAGYAALGLPRVAENPWVGDLLLEAAPGYNLVDDADGDEVIAPPRYRGTHGQRGEHPGNAAFFLVAGPGIRKGVTIPAIRSRDVAPTVAHTLGLRMDAIEGRLLTEALD